MFCDLLVATNSNRRESNTEEIFPAIDHVDYASQGLANADYFVHGGVDDNWVICFSFTRKSLTHLMFFFVRQMP